ncbi:MAG: prepilin-type N-terminal cleavage/methylation domain-containing protein, partial [Bacilli bacterium]
MKKGFTLIELISVIILLGVVSLIAYPIINNSLKGSKQKAYDNQVASIIDLSKRWGVDHVDLLPVGTAEKIITFDDLIKGGYITKTDKGIINPLTDKPMTGCVIVSYSNEYNQYLYRYDEACKINKYVEADLNGNDPVLDNGLIPVMYKDNKWVVAGPSDTWYNYTSKQWANAIIVNANKKAEYIAGKPVVEADVLAYMVWVPRYEYKVGTKEQAIDIKFTTSPTATSGYIMHPAFTFDNKQQKGLWVGKFETTGTAENPTIKPNNVSLTSQNVSAQFNTAQKFNTYGLTNADSHMMKNTEW